jgi:hypothetical protein
MNKYTFTFQKLHKLYDKYFTPRKEITFFTENNFLDFSYYLQIFEEFLNKQIDTDSNEDMELYRNILETIKTGNYYQLETYTSFKRLTLFIDRAEQEQAEAEQEQ